MTVHSTQLYAKAGITTGLNTVYTVPAGYRAILKHIWIRNTAAAAGTAAVEIATLAHGTCGFFYPLAATPAAGSTIGVDVWVVINAGESILYGASNNNNDLILSGTLLKL